MAQQVKQIVGHRTQWGVTIHMSGPPGFSSAPSSVVLALREEPLNHMIQGECMSSIGRCVWSISHTNRRV